MAATETRSTPSQVRHGDAVLAEEVLGHQSTGGGTFRAEGQAATLQLNQLVGTGDGAQSAGSIGNEHAGEFGIDVPLGQHRGPWGLQTGLNTREATEPDKIKTAAAECADGSRIVADGYVLNLNIQGCTQFVGEGSIETVQPLGVLVRNGTDLENLLVRGWCAAASDHGGRKGKSGGETGGLHGRMFSSWHQLQKNGSNSGPAEQLPQSRQAIPDRLTRDSAGQPNAAVISERQTRDNGKTCLLEGMTAEVHRSTC